MGAFNLAGLLEGLEGFSMALYTRVLGKSAEEVQLSLMDIRKELRDPKVHIVRLVLKFPYTRNRPFSDPKASSTTCTLSMPRSRNKSPS